MANKELFCNKAYKRMKASKKKANMVKMADFINWEVMLDVNFTPRYAGPHVDQLSNLFVDSEVIAFVSDDNYQGHDTIVYLFASPDPKYAPKIILVTDYFGSCSGCDAWEDISDEELRELLVAIANNARLFDSFDEIIKFFENLIVKINADESYGEYYDLHGHAHTILKQVKEAEIKLGSVA